MYQCLNKVQKHNSVLLHRINYTWLPGSQSIWGDKYRFVNLYYLINFFFLLISQFPDSSIISFVHNNFDLRQEIFTARKRSLGQDNVFRSVYLSTGRGGYLDDVTSRGGVFVQGGVSVQGSLCLGGLCPGESLSWSKIPRTVKSGRYVSYWNAFLFC